MTATDVAKRTPLQEVCDTVSSDVFKVRVAQALPENVSIERFTRTALTALQQNPELITADRPSLYLSIIKCAQDGLLPDNREAALVIFKVKGQSKVQYLPMIFGLRKKAAEYGFSLMAYTVHEADTFMYSLGLEPHVTHTPPDLRKERGDVIGAYAVATNEATGTRYLDVMNRADIEKVRAVSKTGKSEWGPWANWYEEQCKKTIARRLYKTLPFGSSVAARVLDSADREFDLVPDAGMSVEEANLSASLMVAVPSDDGAPDDELEVAEGELVDEAQAELTFAEQAEAAQRRRAAKGASE